MKTTIKGLNKLTLTGIKNMTKEELEVITPVDQDAVREYELYIDNNATCYEALKYYKANMVKKINKEQFNYSLGVKGLMPIIDAGLQMYIRDLCSPGTKIANLLNINDRVYLYNAFMKDMLNQISEEEN